MTSFQSCEVKTVSERYTKLFSLEEKLYVEHSPVIISGGVLSRDNDTKNLLIQLKFQNICNKNIKGLKVTITTMDSSEQELDADISKKYLYLDISRNEEFGSDQPIAITNIFVRSFKVNDVEVDFSDNSYWSNNSSEWEPIPNQQLLTEKFSDHAICEYKESFGVKSKYIPTTHKNLWLCSCGAANAKHESRCFFCNSDFSEMLNADGEELHNKGSYNKAVYLLNTEKMKNLKSAQKLFEGISKWKDSKEKAEECEKKYNSKKKKYTKITAFTAPIVCAVIVFIVLLNFVIIPNAWIEKVGYSKDVLDDFGAYRALKKEDYKTAIQDYGITDIIIPSGVTSIGNNAFEDCSSLTSVIIPDSVTSIGDDAFYGCSSLTSITIPDSVTSIGEWAFCGCSNLTSVTIPDSVTSIRNATFANCSSLTSVTIPNSVISIGDAAFRCCSSLTSVTIPDSVTCIGNLTFEGCSGLTSVYYDGTATDWTNISIGYYSFANTNATRYYYSETQPTDTTYQYWHYVDGVPTKW